MSRENRMQTVTPNPAKYFLEWNDIKKTVDASEGRYTESVYAMLKNGDLANIKVFGAGLTTWFKFQKGQQNRFFDCWVTVNSFDRGKQGNVSYTFPVFEWGTSLSKEYQIMADNADEKIREYEKGYFSGPVEIRETHVESSEIDQDATGTNPLIVPSSPIDAEIAMHEAIHDDHDDLPF